LLPLRAANASAIGERPFGQPPLWPALPQLVATLLPLEPALRPLIVGGRPAAALC